VDYTPEIGECVGTRGNPGKRFPSGVRKANAGPVFGGILAYRVTFSTQLVGL